MRSGGVLAILGAAVSALGAVTTAHGGWVLNNAWNNSMKPRNMKMRGPGKGGGKNKL